MLLKRLMLLDFLICGSTLEGEKELLKKSCAVRSRGIFSEFRAKYLVFGDGTD